MKNYTSSVPVEVTVMRIEKILVKYGATAVAKEYMDGEVHALTFSVKNPMSGKEIRVRLPANPAGVAKAMMAKVARPRHGTEERINAQAGRTAWKIVQDWAEVQLSMIEMEQAEFIQVFLPYVWDGRRTLYESMKEGGFKMLGEGKREEAKP